MAPAVWNFRKHPMGQSCNSHSDKAAQPLFHIVDDMAEPLGSIMKHGPSAALCGKGLEQRLDIPIYLLENVLGVRKVLPQIQELLHKKLPNHLHSTVTINAKSLGDPVSRRRLYFVGIRRPAAIKRGSF